MALALDGSGNALQALRPGVTQMVTVAATSAATATAVGGTRPAAGNIADPRLIDGLTMWLESFDGSSLVTRDAGNDTFIDAWLDKSGKGNNAIQATAAQQLRLIADGLSAGRPSIRGDGTDTYMDIPPLLTDLASQEFTAIGIAQTDITGAAQRLYSFQEAVGSNTSAYTRFATDNRLEHQVRVSSGLNFSVKSVGVAADGAYHVWCARLNAAPGLLEVALDNEAFQVVDAGGAFAPFAAMTASPMIFGGDFSGAPLQELQGNMPVLAFFDQAISDAAWTALRDGYLMPLVGAGAAVRDVEVIRVAGTADCHIAVGENPVATTSDVFLPAGVPEYFTVKKGVDRVAAIRASVDGVLSVTEMT